MSIKKKFNWMNFCICFALIAFGCSMVYMAYELPKDLKSNIIPQITSDDHDELEAMKNEVKDIIKFQIMPSCFIGQSTG